MKSTFREKVEKLANFLETVPDEKFDIIVWVTSNDINECGTSACAMGWATVCFPNSGLTLHDKRLAYKTKDGYYYDWDAFDAFWEIAPGGIVYDAFMAIFLDSGYTHYPTRSDVIKALREFVNDIFGSVDRYKEEDRINIWD